ncbi:hypothetical protein I6F35_37495 [Bradyrhizobium sp. BRP22]|uniref:hypothetical protein n=1 Tax=Bradyrhizobium sp. BRP22 TaxID=2793821 RepID=UPI001CD22F44|nr:hypothetical protein [Bradyrhizobium sp. BRP22]MCA1458792.1 hypothetical protein [Bradyrhizobium sp. BRP22]
MGSSVPNLILKTDYATPVEETVLEFHMEIPLTSEEIGRIRHFLAENNWRTLKDYVGNSRPQLRHLVSEWIDRTEDRKLGKVISLKANAS